MRPNKPSHVLVLIPAMVDAMGYGMLWPVMPKLISNLTGGDVTQAAVYGGWLLTTFAVIQFLAAPVIGSWSDRIGRKLPLILSLLPLALDSLLLASGISIGWLFAGKILGGTVSGSFCLTSAYMADITPENKRSRNFGLLNAAMGIGFIAGPVLGGILSKYGSHIPCIIAATLSISAILFSMFILPESLPKKCRRRFQWRQANPIGTFIRLKKESFLWYLMVAMALLTIAGESIENIWSYFTVEKFGWTEQLIGYSMGTIGLLFAFVQGIICPFLLPKLGDKRAIFTGLFIQCAAFTGIAFATKEWMLFALTLPYAAGTIYAPAMLSLMANQIPANRQGELQGGLAAIRNLTSIISPLIMTGLFYFFAGKNPWLYLPGMPFLFTAGIILIAIILIRNNFSRNSGSEPVD